MADFTVKWTISIEGGWRPSRDLEYSETVTLADGPHAKRELPLEPAWHKVADMIGQQIVETMKELPGTY